MTSVFTEQVLTAFKLLPIAVDNNSISRSSMYFLKKVKPANDSENPVFEVSQDAGYHICYPRWYKWVVWRAAQEHALNGLIELIVDDFYYCYDNATIILPNNTNFTKLDISYHTQNSSLVLMVT